MLGGFLLRKQARHSGERVIPSDLSLRTAGEAISPELSLRAAGEAISPSAHSGANGRAKKGFTLIEVIVAMAILMVVVIALLGSYVGYYRNVVYERYKTIGENLAQLQLEDIQNLPVSVLSIMVGKNQSGGLGYYPYSPDPSNPSDTRYELDNYIDKETNPAIFDSGEIDSTFRIYRMSGGVTDLEDADIPGVGVEEFTADPSNPNVILYHNLYPGYKKQIVIQDLTPNENEDAKKIFKITVTVFWDNDQKSITVEGLKNDLSYAD